MIRETDVVIVGSGFGAAPPALRLSRAGLRVVVVEKGPHVDPASDFRQTQDPRYLRGYLKSVSSPNLNLIFAEALGGGSGFYEMVSLRTPSQIFRRRGADGRSVWPAEVNRRALDPFYDTAERMLGVHQIAEDRVPKTGQVFSLLMKQLGYSCDRAPHAQNGCVGSGFCVSGCVFGAKQSLHLNYLPQAEASGAVFETDLEAEEIRPVPSDPEDPRFPHRAQRYDIVCRRRKDRETVIFRAGLVILAAGTVGTAALLLRSRRHLPGLSRTIGRNVSFGGSVKVAGLLPRSFPDADMYVGPSHPGMVSYQFFESHGLVVMAGKALPVQIASAAHLRRRGEKRAPADWGVTHVELMKSLRRRGIVLAAFGVPPAPAEITLGPDGKPHVDLPITPSLRAYHARAQSVLFSILERNGCERLETEFFNGDGVPYTDLHFSSAHQLGSCAMADSPERGAAADTGELFGCPGIFVTDGAALSSALTVNPSLTILANAERITTGILDRYRGTYTHSSSLRGSNDWPSEIGAPDHIEAREAGDGSVAPVDGKTRLRRRRRLPDDPDLAVRIVGAEICLGGGGVCVDQEQESLHIPFISPATLKNDNCHGSMPFIFAG